MEESPVLVISGARQVGKSTLMRKLLAGREDCLIVSLDEARLRSAAQQDPDGFADQYPEGGTGDRRGSAGARTFPSGEGSIGAKP